MLGEGKNPRDAKVRLAKEIVALYYSAEAAVEAENYFVETFSKKKQPVEAEEAAIPVDAVGADGLVSVASLISGLGLAKSNGEARRLMASGAVSLDGEKLSDGFATLTVGELRGRVLRVGKHQFRKLV
jgi:tyrosyl-tRNA synthetase